MESKSEESKTPPQSLLTPPEEKEVEKVADFDLFIFKINKIYHYH